MIHDKDYIMRIVRQFSNMLAKFLLDKNEAEFLEFKSSFDTQMNDVFKMNFKKLSVLNLDEIIDFVQQKDDSQHADYYELLGNIFYLKGIENNNKDFLQKSKTFYELYLKKSGIFSLPIIKRINEI